MGMDRDERGEVARLAGAVEGLVRAVEGIGVVLEQQGWMLRQLLDAAVTPAAQESKLHRLLEQLVVRLDAQAGVLARVEEGLERVGVEVEVGESGQAG